MKRRLFVATTMSSALAACAPIGTALNGNSGFHSLLGSAQTLNHALIDTHGMAKEYKEGDISSEFPIDSLPTPSDANYTALLRGDFRDYKLLVDGAVARRGVFPLAMLERLCNATQITRHDCVEGWSVVAKWSGIRLGAILDLVEPRSDARYVVFHCLDKDDQGTQYYESLDLHQARHPQTILAMRMNNRPVPPDHGGPVRLKVPTQLGYKSAKWVSRIEVVGSYKNIAAVAAAIGKIKDTSGTRAYSPNVNIDRGLCDAIERAALTAIQVQPRRRSRFASTARSPHRDAWTCLVRSPGSTGPQPRRLFAVAGCKAR